MLHRWLIFIVATLAAGDLYAQEACEFSYPVGDERTAAPLENNHPVGGMNLPDFGAHLGADFWSGLGCTDLGQSVYAVADGEVVEIVDALGSYLDVVVIRHEVDDIGNVYSMYGHIARDDALVEGALVERRQQIGTIADVLAYFSPCHLHFELLNEAAYQNGPFCSGCEAAGYHVSPGYDRQTGVQEGTHPTSGDRYLDVLNDGVDGNHWFFVNDFVDARIDKVCVAEMEPAPEPELDMGTGEGDTGTSTGPDTGEPVDFGREPIDSSRPTVDGSDPEGASDAAAGGPTSIRGEGGCCATTRGVRPPLWLLIVALFVRRRRG